jgi:hypothetical protein
MKTYANKNPSSGWHKFEAKFAHGLDAIITTLGCGYAGSCWWSVELPLPNALKTDVKIWEEVKNSISRILVVSECPIEVEVLNGRVTLLGSMSNWILRADIEAVVKKLPGVIGVINLISIKKTATGKAIKTPRGHLSETEVTVWIMIAILLALTILAGYLFSKKLML